MAQFPYTLEKYNGQKTRHTCPQCLKKKEFTRYVIIETNQYIHETVGKCNNENKCGWHYKPKQYFEDNKSLVPPTRTYKPKYEAPKPTSYIHKVILIKSMKQYEKNNFVMSLKHQFGEAITNEVINKYKIGTSKYWKGATVFWQIDYDGRIRTGEIMLYNGFKRHKFKNWVHSVMEYKDFTLKQCFFGEHLINNNTNEIAIVESAKTAVVCSIFFPQFTWLATAGSGGINSEKLKPLKDRTVVLFPDASVGGKMFLKWKDKTKHLDNVFVNDFLEIHTNEKEKIDGVDLADFLLEYSLSEFQNQSIRKAERKTSITLKLMIYKNPIIEDLVNNLDLEIG